MHQEHLRGTSKGEHLSEGTPVQPPREPAGGVPLPCRSGESGRGARPSTEVEGRQPTREEPAANPGRAEQTKEQRRV